jgi:hypothetical protein
VEVWTIYSLTVEGEELPFYVGCTARGDLRRVIEHRCDGLTRFPSSPKGDVMRGAAIAGKKVFSEVLEKTADEKTAFEAEIKWIARFGRRPAGPLVNKTDGGLGNKGWNASTETRARMAESKLGNQINVGRARPDMKERFSQAVTAHGTHGLWIGSFASAREAAETLRVSFGQISAVLTGRINATKSKDGKVYQFRKGQDTSPMDEVVYRSQTSRRK